MTVLLKDAMQPNLVQTLENNPAFVHGGPFANIAHGCNSVVATTTALSLPTMSSPKPASAPILGARRSSSTSSAARRGLKPAAAVIVATVRAMKMNGGVKKDDLGAENVEAVKKGLPEPRPPYRQHQGLRRAGGRGDQPLRLRHGSRNPGGEGLCRGAGCRSDPVQALANGSEGIEELAKKVVELAESGVATSRRSIPTIMGLFQKIETIAKRIYHADEVIADKSVRAQLKAWEDEGYGHLPVCMAKTQYSFTTDPNLRGAPTGHSVPVREVRLSAGAGFIVVICGAIMTMPGLPRKPSSEVIRLDDNLNVEGLF